MANNGAETLDSFMGGVFKNLAFQKKKNHHPNKKTRGIQSIPKLLKDYNIICVTTNKKNLTLLIKTFNSKRWIKNQL